MRRLSSLAWRSLRARRARTLLTIGRHRARRRRPVRRAGHRTPAIDASVDRTVRDLSAAPTCGSSAFAGGGPQRRDLAAIDATPGVAVAAPAHRTADLPRPGCRRPDPLRAPVTVLGIDPALDARVHDLSGAGHALFGPGTRAALISETLAAEDGLGLGSVITLSAGSAGQVDVHRGRHPRRRRAASDAGGRTVVIPHRRAKVVFGLSGVAGSTSSSAPGHAWQVSGRLEARSGPSPTSCPRRRRGARLCGPRPPTSRPRCPSSPRSRCSSARSSSSTRSR